MLTREPPPVGHKLMTRVRVRLGDGASAKTFEATIRARWYAIDGSGWRYSCKSPWTKELYNDIPHDRLEVLSAPVIQFDPKSRATPRQPGARYATTVARPA